MKESIKIFENAQFGQIRTLVTDSGEPLFCLVDLCKILGLGNPSQVKTTLRKDGVISNDVSTPIVSQGVNTGKTKVMALNFITEPNLYKCIFQSRKKEAEQFQDWVCSEVLPSIRKTGGYITSKPEDTDEDIMARAFLVATRKIEEREQRIRMLEATTELQQNQIEVLSPKAEYTDHVLQAKSTYTFTQLAKELGMTSAQALSQRLKDLKIIFKQSGQWLLMAKYADKGYTTTRTATFINGQGETSTNVSTVWTETGRHFLHTLFSNLKNNK